jgi:hypothetical protein
MTAIIGENAEAAWLAGLAGVRAKARERARRALDCAAATVLVCAVGAALVQLVAELVSFPAPIAVTAITVTAAALLNGLRRIFAPGQAPVRPGRPARDALSVRAKPFAPPDVRRRGPRCRRHPVW